MKDYKFNLVSDWFVLLLILVTIISGIVLYPSLPDQIPSHWNIQGDIDQYTSPLGHILSFAGLMIGMYLLFLFLPRIEPRKEHFKKSMGFYLIMKNLLISFFFILYAAITYSTVQNIDLPIDIVISIPLGIILIYMGNYLSLLESNYFMGIRTPWTLQNEEVWKRTHRVGGKVFIIAGILFIASLLLPKPSGYYIPVIFLVLSAAYLVAYSFYLYQKATK